MTKKENERLAIVEVKITNIENDIASLTRKIDNFIDTFNKDKNIQDINIEKIKTKANTNRIMFWGILSLLISLFIVEKLFR